MSACLKCTTIKNKTKTTQEAVYPVVSFAKVSPTPEPETLRGSSRESKDRPSPEQTECHRKGCAPPPLLPASRRAQWRGTKVTLSGCFRNKQSLSLRAVTLGPCSNPPGRGAHWKLLECRPLAIVPGDTSGAVMTRTCF